MNKELRDYLIQIMNILGQMNNPGRESKDVGWLMSIKDRQHLITEGWKLIESNDSMNVYLANLRKENL